MITFDKMKFCCLSDLHLVPKNPICRKDDLVIRQWDKLNEVYGVAFAENADILIAGDLHAISNDYKVLSCFAVFLKNAQDMGVKTWAVYGQHDMKHRNPENTNMEILINSGLINLIPKEGMKNAKNKGVIIYGCSWMDDVPEPMGAAINILVVHAPLSPKALFSGHNYIDPSAFMYEHPFDIIFCGDVHRTFEVASEYNSGVCLNSGPLLRREADEYAFEHKPGFWLLDLENIFWEYREVTHQPAEMVITRGHINQQKAKTETFNEANAAKFLYELKARTSGDNIIKIEDRMKRRIIDPANQLSSGAVEVIETLMNGKGLEKWLQKQESPAEPKRIQRVKA